MTEIEIVAHPFEEQWALVCSVCGPLGIATESSADPAAQSHLLINHAPVTR